MKKTVFRAIMTLIVIAFVIVSALVGISIVSSKNSAELQARKDLYHLSERYASDFNAVFSNSTILVNNFSSYAEQEFARKGAVYDSGTFLKKKKKAREVMHKMIKNSNYPIGLYITFDPYASQGKNEIWYVKNSNGKVKWKDSIALSKSEWLSKNDPNAEYYYQAIKRGTYWSKAAYDPGMDGKVISYVRAIYDKNGRFIGVVGTDIVLDDLFNSLGKIDKEIKGHTALVDNKGGLITGSDPKKYLASDKYITARASIGSNWEIVLAQSLNVATEPIIKTEAAVIILGVLIIIAVIMLIVFYSRRKVRPIVEEVEQKDMVLISQARQAKMGEMIGNIAHQWKQPLNNINMALSNMQDDYVNGMMSNEEFEQYVSRIRAMLANLADTADDFTKFLRPGRRTEKFSVTEEVKNVLNMMDERMKLAGITTEMRGQEVFLTGLRNEFSQCLFNLFDNARDALIDIPENDRKIIVTTMENTMKDGSRLSIVKVFNNGGPVREENTDKLFDLYYTTKGEKSGTGIGLYLTKKIIEDHYNGTITFQNREKGVEFAICIPHDKGGGTGIAGEENQK